MSARRRRLNPDFCDLKGQPLEQAEVEDLARKVGGAENLFSTRAMKYRQMGLCEQELSCNLRR